MNPLRLAIGLFLVVAICASAQQPEPCPSCTPKVCVSEPVKKTKIVYAVKCEEYCLPKCSILNFFRPECDCECGCVRTRKVLVKKKVPACDESKCVVKDAGPEKAK